MLRDHFHQPLSVVPGWEGFHSAWTTLLALELNQVLPPHHLAIPQTSRGPMIEIDVATVATSPTIVPQAWQPESPRWSTPVIWPTRDLFEVRVIDQRDGNRLVAAIELISPANKDRPAERQAFCGKCAGYLRQGIGLVLVDVVTTRHYNMHAELLRLLEIDPTNATASNATPSLYAVSYRTIHEEQAHLDVWPYALQLDTELPTLPLWIGPAHAVPVPLAASYNAALRLFRLL